MGLKGNISTVSLSDIFQLLNRGRSSGVLEIQTGNGKIGRASCRERV